MVVNEIGTPLYRRKIRGFLLMLSQSLRGHIAEEDAIFKFIDSKLPCFLENTKLVNSINLFWLILLLKENLRG